MRERVIKKDMTESLAMRVRALNLVPVRYILAVKHRWSMPRVLRAEAGYRRFLQGIGEQSPHSRTPSADVDEFWHAHILCTQLYSAACQQLFGRYLHHAPFGPPGAPPLPLHSQDSRPPAEARSARSPVRTAVSSANPRSHR